MQIDFSEIMERKIPGMNGGMGSEDLAMLTVVVER